MEGIEGRLAELPTLVNKAVVLIGGVDGVAQSMSVENEKKRFMEYVGQKIVPDVGHNLPQEAPAIFYEAVLALRS